MHLSITHKTDYNYSQPLLYSIQQLKLTPQDGFGQKVKSWAISVNGQLYQYDDTYGNVTHTLVLDANSSDISIVAKGEVETGLPYSEFLEKLPLTLYLRSTQLTQADANITELARSFGQIRSISDLEKLSHVIVGRVTYSKGVTGVYTTASQALETGTGVCQDHAHIFIACCREMNVPARYVSGYLFTERGDLLESHAWVDTWLEGEGWKSVDVSNQRMANGEHVRLAVGLDYHDACPVSGIRVGGGTESMAAGVKVSQLQGARNSSSKEQLEQTQQ
jgi:transglutaminase-like putative cysteine protease